MNKYCIGCWNKNKDRLQKRIENSIDHNSWNYKTLVKLIIEEVLNPGEELEDNTWNSEEITVIDNGEDTKNKLKYPLVYRSYKDSVGILKDGQVEDLPDELMIKDKDE